MQRVYLNKYLLLWTLVFSGLWSCSLLPKGEKISDVDRPLLELQKSVASSLPMGRKSNSENAREFYSNPYKLKGSAYEAAKPTENHNIAEILVLGDRRPYKIEINVYLIVNSQRVAKDNKLEKRLKNEILQDLAKRRENRNVIDSFRPF